MAAESLRIVGCPQSAAMRNGTIVLAWHLGIAVLLLVAQGISWHPVPWWGWWIAWWFIAGVNTLLAYAIDKRRAQREDDRWRYPEIILHGMCWIGGVAGGWIGRQVLRHKSRKPAFLGHLIGATVVHVLLFAAALWFLVLAPGGA